MNSIRELSDFVAFQQLIPKKIKEVVHRGGKVFPRERIILVKPEEIKVEEAPSNLIGLIERRKEAKNRIIEWKNAIVPMSDWEIIYDGYKWRKWAHVNNIAWDWAVWEEIQKLASQHGYDYAKNIIGKQELLDNPLLPDTEEILGSSLESDMPVTNYRNQNKKEHFYRFITSKAGSRWRIISLRELWGHIIRIPEDKAKEYYPGFVNLKKVETWKEALDTEVVVYRGILGKVERAYDSPIVSYTTSPQVAKKFAKGYLWNYEDAGPDTGIVLKRTVKFGELYGYLNPDGENEVILRPPQTKIEEMEE